jgi:farnesyl diphosphate synthase
VGDALIPLAFQILSTLDATADVRVEVMAELSRVIGSTGLVAGQMMDLDQEDWPRTYEGLLELQRLKTGVLFGFALEAGAILGHAPSHERKALKSYGLLVGQAFQMIDDWLDAHSHQEALGKPCGQDEKKFTFLTLLGPELLQEKTQEILDQAIQELAPFGERAALLREAALDMFGRSMPQSA